MSRTPAAHRPSFRKLDGKPRVKLGFAALLAVGAFISGCATDGGPVTTDSSTPVYGGTMTYATDREPTCLDPHNAGDMPQTYIARQYLDSLVSELPDGKVVPWLATSWAISPNGEVYTFQIKKGVKFTDGTPLNAQAVVDNFEQELNPATESSTDWGYLEPYYKSSKALSTYTVQLTLKQPDAPLLDELAQAFFGIESPKAMARGLTANCESPVGTGPFIVKQWIRGESVTLIRNPDYNSAPANAEHQGPAYLSEVIWRFLEEQSVRYAALQDGEVDIIFNIPPEDQTAAEDDPDFTVEQFMHSGQPNNITLNAAEAPFNSPAVRQAFLYGADAEAAVRSAFFGAYPYDGGSISTGTPDYDSAYADDYPYDPAKANELLNEAGWTGRNAEGYRTKDGKVLTVVMPYSSNTGDTPAETVTLYQDIQAEEKEIGFDLVLKPEDEATFDDLFAGYDPTGYNAIGGSYWNSPTPAVLYIVYSPTTRSDPNPNNGDYASNSTLDNILLEATGTTDTAKQEALYDEAQKIAASEAWELDLWPVTTDLGISKSVHGVWIEPSEGEPVLSDAWLAKS
jgi:peptide/nickel transport system substrate-binding protein